MDNHLFFLLLSGSKSSENSYHQVKGELYAACFRSVMLYGSENWPIKVEESQRLTYV